MVKYSDSARNCHVLVDGNENVNAALECNRLYEENRAMRKRVAAVGLRFDKAWVMMEDLSNYLRTGR